MSTNGYQDSGYQYGNAAGQEPAMASPFISSGILPQQMNPQQNYYGNQPSTGVPQVSSAFESQSTQYFGPMPAMNSVYGHQTVQPMYSAPPGMQHAQFQNAQQSVNQIAVPEKQYHPMGIDSKGASSGKGDALLPQEASGSYGYGSLYNPAAAIPMAPYGAQPEIYPQQTESSFRTNMYQYPMPGNQYMGMRAESSAVSNFQQSGTFPYGKFHGANNNRFMGSTGQSPSAMNSIYNDPNFPGTIGRGRGMPPNKRVGSPFGGVRKRGSNASGHGPYGPTKSLVPPPNVAGRGPPITVDPMAPLKPNPDSKKAKQGPRPIILTNRNPVSILYEHVQSVYLPKPTWDSEKRIKHPFGFDVYVIVNDVKYGPAIGASLKEARNRAALLYLRSVRPPMDLSQLAPIVPGIYKEHGPTPTILPVPAAVGQFNVPAIPKFSTPAASSSALTVAKKTNAPANSKKSAENEDHPTDQDLSISENIGLSDQGDSLVKNLYNLGPIQILALLNNVTEHDPRISKPCAFQFKEIGVKSQYIECLAQVQLKQSKPNQQQSVTIYEGNIPVMPKGGFIITKGTGGTKEIAKAVACSKMLQNLMPFYENIEDMIKAISNMVNQEEGNKAVTEALDAVTDSVNAQAIPPLSDI